MAHFLENTARFLHAKFGNDYSEIAVVLPNRRAGLYLRRYLSKGLTGPAWSPQFFSIEDFLVTLSGLKELEPLPLLFELYEVHRSVEGEKAQPFEEFLHWGQQLISDFNEVDRYLVDPHALFTYLDEARAISLWNLENQPLTEFEQNYLRFYHNLFIYYRELTEHLLTKGLGYPGLIFRQAAAKAGEYAARMPFRHIVFAGFNALTRAEEEIITVLHRNRKATLLWDADHYYLDDEHQEAGMFLREWIRKWPSGEIRWVTDNFSEGAKNIRVLGAPDQMGQVKHCGNILRDLIRRKKSEESTAVVLLDPSLLIPLLNSLPPEIKDLNITAGLPLAQTSVAGLFESLFRLHMNAERFTYAAASATPAYYYKDLLNLLCDPLVRRIASTYSKGNRFSFEDVTDRIRKGQRVFLTAKDVLSQDQDLFSAGVQFLETLLLPWKDTRMALRGCRMLLDLLRRSFTGDELKLEMEYAYAFTKIINQLAPVAEKFANGMNIPALYQLFRHIMASTMLPFSGEPLNGIQIMGMLETRTLDFENIILVSCNEDLLPSSKSTPSFIPFDIKRNFGLPTFRHKDAVYAYHFYRLLQGAKEVWILYGTEPDQLGGGDKSRFIKQILHELPACNPSVKISESFLVSPVRKSALQQNISVEKNPEVMKLLRAKAERGFSATSLNAFRNCSLKFYFTEIAGIREPDDMEDDIDPAILGSAVHDALHRLYKPFEKKPVLSSDVESMIRIAAESVEAAFTKKYKGSDTRYGKNLLLVHVAKLMVSRFLKFEKQLLDEGNSLRIDSLEYYLDTSIPASRSVTGEVIRFKGIMDRIDRLHDQVRIIDYKTGNVDPRFLKINEWDDLLADPGYNIAFQLMFYAFLVKDRILDGKRVVPGIYPLRKINSGILGLTLPQEKEDSLPVNEEQILKFEEILMQIIGSVFDPTAPFSQTNDTDTCRYCPFAVLCGR